MTRTIWIGVGIILIILGLSMLLFSNETEAPENSAPNLSDEDADFVPEQSEDEDDNQTSVTGDPNEPVSNVNVNVNAQGEVDISEDTIEEVFVTYTNSGFSPRTITINRGQTVRFVNNSSRNMWVASDPHPTHTIYPEFDSKRGVVSGSHYEFTFNRVGTWNYHDHLNASMTGTVIVR
jgi:plastocyanin